MVLYEKPTDTQRFFPYPTSHPKHLRELKENFRTYGYPKKVVEIRIQKTLKIPQTKLRQAKAIKITTVIIRTFNPNNSKIFDFVKSGVNALVENNVNGFKNIRLIHTKRQPPNLKKFSQISYSQIKQLVYSNAQTACAYAVSNFHWKSHIRLKTLVNNSFKKQK